MKTNNLFKVLLSVMLLVFGTDVSMAQTATWNRGETKETDIWFWYRSEGTTTTNGGVKGNDAYVTPFSTSFSMTDDEGTGTGWSRQTLSDGKVISLKTGNGTKFRTVVENLSLSITVPAGQKVKYTYEMETYISVSDGYSAGACELFYWGEEDKTASYTYNTSDNNSASGTETICKAYVSEKGNNTATYQITFDCDNSTGTSEKTYTYYFAVLAYVRYANFLTISLPKTAEAYVKPILKNKEIENDNSCLSIGDLYMDYQLNISRNDNNSSTAAYTGDTNDGLRLASQITDRSLTPYMWNDNISLLEDGGFRIGLKTVKDDSDWRVGVGMFSNSQSVPAYSSLNVKYDYKLTSTKDNSNHNSYHGAELIHFGETPWTVNKNDKFTTQTEATGFSGATSILNCSDNSGTLSQEVSLSSYGIEYNNAESETSRNVSHNFALKSFIWRNGNKNVSESAVLEAINPQITTTYYAYITYDANDGSINSNWDLTKYPNPQVISKTSDGYNQGTVETDKLYDGNIVTRTGYTFTGWNTMKDGSGKGYSAGENFCPYTNEDGGRGVGSVTLYAQWEAQTITVYFYKSDANSSGQNPDYRYPTKGSAYYVTTGSDDNYICPVGECKKEGYIFDGWFTNGGFMVYDSHLNGFKDNCDHDYESGWAFWNKDGSWAGKGENPLHLYPKWTKIASNVNVSVQKIYEDGLTVNSCIEKDKRFIGATIGADNSEVISDGFEGDSYITTDCVNFLSDQPVPNQQQVQSVTKEQAPLWHFTRAADGSYTIQSKNNGCWLGYESNGAIKLIDKNSTPVVWYISQSGFIAVGSDFKWNLCYSSNRWSVNSRGIQAQDVAIKVFAEGNGTAYSADVISTLKSELSKEDYRYTVNDAATDDNVFKGLLYVDMSGVSNIIESSDSKWSDFQKNTAANCLLFLPQTYTVALDETSKNIVAKQSDGTYAAQANFVLTDIDQNYGDGYTNPFYSPYSFSVDGDLTANYTREISNISQTSTMMLPFSVKLARGVSNGVGFYTITKGDMSNPNSCSLEAGKIEGNAEANKPYHVKGTGSTLSIAEKDTEVEATEVKEYTNEMGGWWTAYSNYFGKLQPKSTSVYYYNGGLYFNSLCTSADYVYADPYRAYFVIGNWAHNNAKSYRVVFEDDASGIESTTVVEPTDSGSIYTISGVKVDGKPQQHGIYIVNGKKQIF